MLIAQMDAAITPLGPTSSDTSELERALDAIKATDARADFPRALRFATDSLRGVENAEIVIVSDGRLGEAVDASGKVHLGDDIKLSYIPIGRGVRNVGITAFSVRRYPLDKSRYEVMLEVTNTGPETEDVELSLYADPKTAERTGAGGERGQLVDLTKLRLKPGERLPRFYPNLSGASRALEASLVALPNSVDELPADNHAYALLPERRRAKVLVVTPGNTYLEAALLLDEYLDVQLASPREYAEKIAPSGQKHDVVIFDGATPSDAPRSHAIYLDPRGPGSPVKVENELKSPGFDRIERKHPIVRWTALDDVNIARGRKLVPQPGDKVVGASVDGPILVTGQRGGYKFVAMGFDVRDSDLPLRVAWPLLLLNSVNFFTDEDSQYISSFRTGDVWRVPVVTQTGQARLRTPSGTELLVPVHEGRAVYLGEQAGFYELAGAEGLESDEGSRCAFVRRSRAGSEGRAFRGVRRVGCATTTAAFAANLLDAEESSNRSREGAHRRRQEGRLALGLPDRRAPRDLDLPPDRRPHPDGDRVDHVPPEDHGMTLPGRTRLGILGVALAAVAIGIFVSNKLTSGLVWGFLTQRTDLLLTGAIAAGCGWVVLKALVDLVAPGPREEAGRDGEDRLRGRRRHRRARRACGSTGARS